MFKKRKLATKKRFKYQYGKSQVIRRTVQNSKNKLRTNGPSGFHARKRKRISLSSLIPKIPSKLKRLSIVLGVLIVFFGGIYLIGFSSVFNITDIKVSTEQITTESLSSNIIDDLRIYKGKNLLFIKKDEIIQRIQSSYPEIENINVGKDLFSTLVISFSEYPPIANITNVSNESNKKFIVNSIGYIVKENMDDPELPYIKIISEAPINTDSSVIDQEQIEYILGSKTYFEEKFGMKIIEVEYQIVPREVHLRTEKYFYIWLDIQIAYEQQLKKLKKALVKLDIYNEELSYIDLRITGESGEKIIYKRR